MQCGKCGSTMIELRKDARNLPVAYCAECGNKIKNMSTTDVVEYYEQREAQFAEVAEAMGEPKTEADKPVCSYCFEEYYYKIGRLGHVYNRIETKYCPNCGRKRKPDDLNYHNV